MKLARSMKRGMRSGLFAAGLGMTTLLAAHGILPKEEQFPGGVPIRLPDLLEAEQYDPFRQGLQKTSTGWRYMDGHQPVPVVTLRLTQPVVSPEVLRVEDETQLLIRLVNDDHQAHLLALGTAQALQDQSLMHTLLPASLKDYPNSRFVPAGGEKWLHWRFNRVGVFFIRCLLPEHGHTPQNASRPVEWRIEVTHPQ